MCHEKHTPYSLEHKPYKERIHQNTKSITQYGIKVSAQGKTLEEVFTNFRDEIWRTIPEFKLENMPDLDVTVSRIVCHRLDDSLYEASCICDIIKSIDTENEKNNNDDEVELS